MSSDDHAHRGVASPLDPHSSVDRCPDCSGALQIRANETFCDDCGLIVAEDQLDRGPEWRWFDGDGNDAERTGAPLTVTRHDRGLSTEIGWDSVDSGRKRRQLNRLRREHGRAQFRSKAERNLAHGFGEIKRVVAALDLPSEVRDRACAIYRRAQAENLLLGRSVDSMASASLYAACRCLGLPRSIDEIGEFAHVDLDRVQMAFRVLNRELALPTRTVGPATYLPKLASATGVEDVVRHRALEFARCAETAGVANGRNPAGVAAACLYGAAVETGYQVTPTGTLTQQVVADLAEVSTATVRSSWQALEAHCGELDG